MTGVPIQMFDFFRQRLSIFQQREMDGIADIRMMDVVELPTNPQPGIHSLGEQPFSRRAECAVAGAGLVQYLVDKGSFLKGSGLAAGKNNTKDKRRRSRQCSLPVLKVGPCAQPPRGARTPGPCLYPYRERALQLFSRWRVRLVFSEGPGDAAEYVILVFGVHPYFFAVTKRRIEHAAFAFFVGPADRVILIRGHLLRFQICFAVVDAQEHVHVLFFEASFTELINFVRDDQTVAQVGGGGMILIFDLEGDVLVGGAMRFELAVDQFCVIFPIVK